MALARKYQILSGQPGFYHCFGRCVRRAFLCGQDRLSGRDFSHRRRWMVERLALLSSAFAIDVYAYAIMNNHWHVVLFVDPERTQTWSDEDVIARWKSLYRWRHPDAETRLPTPEQLGAQQLARWRERLGDVSWFMKSIHEPLARLSNLEDDCTGHFWDGRFRSTALLDDPAVIAATAYVDLNPIKAGLASSLLGSDHTSIQRRLRQFLYALKRLPARDAGDKPQPADAAQGQTPVRPVFSSGAEGLKGSTAQSAGPFPALSLQQYVAIVDETARELVGEAFTKAPAEARTALAGFPVAPPGWQQIVCNFERLFRRAAGATDAIDQFVAKIGRRRRVDITGARLLTRKPL